MAALVAARDLGRHALAVCRMVGNPGCQPDKKPQTELQSTHFTGGGNRGLGRKEVGLFNTTKVVDVRVKVGGAVQESQPGLAFLGPRHRYPSAL